MLLNAAKCYRFWVIKGKPTGAKISTPDRVKIASCTAWGDLGTSLLLPSSRLFLSLILLSKFELILPGRNYSSHEKKKLTKFVYFLETTIYESSIF